MNAGESGSIDPVGQALPPFRDCLAMQVHADASALASGLFRESFGGEFPRPRAIQLGAVRAEAGDWRQVVALYRWPDGCEECVGFVNWIKFRNGYLGGALSVKRDFYRRLPSGHFRECRRGGGVAQIMLEFCAGALADGDSWFAYCGDTKSLRVNTRVGFVTTDHRYILVKWFKEPAAAEARALIDEVAALGPF